MIMENKISMRRRLQFSTFVLVSQMLLIALSISWIIHMVIIAIDGSAYFVENNPLILWSEITASLLITIFAIFILITQIKRLGERRRTDRRGQA
jgi:uncharacterized membrane protein YbhN (UPF0104 family)